MASMSPDYTLVDQLYGGSSAGSGNGQVAPSGLTPREEIVVRDEGNVIAKTLTDINFVGSGVVASQDPASGKLTVAISATAGSPGALTVNKQNNSGTGIGQYAVVSERPDGTIALATVAAVQDELALGLALDAISNSQFGDVQVAGEIENALAALVGIAPEDPVYVGNIPGELTNVAPTGPGQLICLVGYASGSSGQNLRLDIRKIGRNS